MFIVLRGACEFSRGTVEMEVRGRLIMSYMHLSIAAQKMILVIAAHEILRGK